MSRSLKEKTAGIRNNRVNITKRRDSSCRFKDACKRLKMGMARVVLSQQVIVNETSYANNRLATATVKKTRVSTMVVMNKVFSTPRRDANTFPSPPNVEPNPVPRCCNKIAAISSTESTICIIPRICVSGIIH